MPADALTGLPSVGRAAPVRPTRRTLLAGGSAAAAALLMRDVAAQSVPDYPSRPVRIVVPWPAGGATDLATRAFSGHLGKRLGTNVVVENRGGATGMIGSAAVATAAPDGYTLLLASAETHAINPFTYEKLAYDPEKDFSPLGAFATNPYAVVSRADFPAASIRALVDEAKRSPGTYTYGSAGTGSASQIVMEMFKLAESMDIRHIPFQGEAPAVTALMGGQVDLMILPVGRAMALRKTDKVKVHAVTQSTRFPGMPDVPTMSEAGFTTIAVANWFGLMAPAKTPDAIVALLADAVASTAQQDEVIQGLDRIGLGPFPKLDRAAFVAFVAGERTRWRSTIERVGIRVGQ